MLLTFSLSVFVSISSLLSLYCAHSQNFRTGPKRKGQLSSTGTGKRLIFRFEPIKDNKFSCPYSVSFLSHSLFYELPVVDIDYGIKDTHLGCVWIFLQSHRAINSPHLSITLLHFGSRLVNYENSDTLVFIQDVWTLASILEE